MGKLFLSFLVLFILLGCGDSRKQQSYLPFVYDANQNYEIEVCVEYDFFLEKYLNNYTDPKLRQIIHESDKHSSNPKEFFEMIASKSEERDYDLNRYLIIANEEIFTQFESKDEISEYLQEEYSLASSSLFNYFKLKSKGLEFSVNIVQTAEMMFQLQCEDENDSTILKSLASNKSELTFEELISIQEVLPFLIHLDTSKYEGNSKKFSSDDFLAYTKDVYRPVLGNTFVHTEKIFRNKLDLGPIVDQSYTGAIQFDNYTLPCGVVHKKDTAFVAEIFKSNLNLIWTGILWEEQDDDLFTLLIRRPVEKDADLRMLHIQKFQHQLNDSNEWNIVFILTDEGEEFFYNMSEIYHDKALAMIHENEIIGVPDMVQTWLTMTVIQNDLGFITEETQGLAVTFAGAKEYLEAEEIVEKCTTSAPTVTLQLITHKE
ncbi:MAG: hypothetical protein ACI857_000513 [Arenicella sp.]|jgi:hypothetical protein